MFNVLILVAIALFIFAFALTYYKIEYGFYLYVLTIPLMHKELFSLGYWDLLPVRVIAVGITLATIIKLIKFYLKNEKNRFNKDDVIKVVKNDYFLVLLLLLLIVRIITIPNANNFIYSIGLLLFFFFAVAIYIIYKALLTRKGEVLYYNLLKIYLGVSVAVLVFAYIQLILNVVFGIKFGGIWVNPGNLPRIGAGFWDVNHFGGYLITLIPITFSLIFAFKKTIYRGGFFILTVLLFVLLFLTQSRSAWIGVITSFSLTILIYYLMKLKRPVIFIFVLTISLFVMALSVIVYKQVNVIQTAKDYMHYRLDSTDTHVMLLEGAGEIYINNLPIGAGYGNFSSAFKETDTAQDYFSREPKLLNMRVPPHSIWGESIAETGTIGVVTYATFAILLIGSLIYTVSIIRDKFKKYLGVGFIGGLIGIFTAGLFYSYNMEFYWFYIFLAIGFVYISLGKKFDLVAVLKWWYVKPITPYLIIVPPSLFFIFIKLGNNTLIDWDEAIYAKVSKNILESGDWLNLHWTSLGRYWFEKPPLYMWFTAVLFKLLGYTEFAVRLASAVFGFLGIILTYKFGEKLYNKLTGIIAALILLSTTHYLYYSRIGMLDVTLTFFITLSLYLFYIAVEKYNESSKKVSKDKKHEYKLTGNYIIDNQFIVNTYLILSGVSVGLAIMTKAVVGLLPLLVMIVYAIYIILFTNKKFPLSALLLTPLFMLVIALPWHIYMIISHGRDFLDDYILTHIFDRGFEGMGHEQPFYWFFTVIKTSMRIWIIPLILGIITLPFIDKRHIRKYIFILSTVLIITLFFSLSKDKLQWYIIPVYPFTALISARLIDRLLVSFNAILKKDKRLDYKLLRIVTLFILVILSIVYIIVQRDKIWLRDPNSDKVALIRINNEIYPTDKFPNKKLYYIRDASPALLFYTDHDIKRVKNEGKIFEKLDNAEPDESLVFLIPDSMYYALDEKTTPNGTPIDFKEKGSAGGWILVRSISRVGVLRARLEILTKQAQNLINKPNSKFTDKDKETLTQLIDEIFVIANQLKNYGYPPNFKDLELLRAAALSKLQ